MSRLVQQTSDGNGKIPGKMTFEETTATREERGALEADIGNLVQDAEQKLPPQDQIRAKEMIIPEGKTTMTNVDYVGRRTIGQRTAVTVLLVEVLPTLNETPLGIKERKKPT